MAAGLGRSLRELKMEIYPTQEELEAMWVQCADERVLMGYRPDLFARRIIDWHTEQLRKQEPIYAFRRKGLADFCTCDERRYNELAQKPMLFEVKKFYAAPVPAPQEGSWINSDSVKELALQLDQAMNGEGAAQSPQLCDVVSQACEIFKQQREQKPANWKPLEEDQSERRIFDRALREIYKGDPRLAVAHTLRTFANTMSGGTFANTCRVMANEVAKLYAAPVPAPAVPEGFLSVVKSVSALGLHTMPEGHDDCCCSMCDLIRESRAMLSAATQAPVINQQAPSEDKKDAERYRWLRLNGPYCIQYEYGECGVGSYREEAMDAAIDAAMKGGE